MKIAKPHKTCDDFCVVEIYQVVICQHLTSAILLVEQNKVRLACVFLQMTQRQLAWVAKIESLAEYFYCYNYKYIMRNFNPWGSYKTSTTKMPFQATQRKPVKKWKLLYTFQCRFLRWEQRFIRNIEVQQREHGPWWWN